MKDEDCVAFLQWCLPRLGLRWPGYRRVRRTVCKRVSRRVRELGIDNLQAYRQFLAETPAEWRELEAICRIPISRFWRDREVFCSLRDDILPQLAARAQSRSAASVSCWSAGCASGEEAYSLQIAWSAVAERRWPKIAIEILATDADETMLRRARAGCYKPGSLKDLPADYRDRAFVRSGAIFRLSPKFRRNVTIALQDLRTEMPDGPFDLILCRNLAFTYFDPPTQRKVLAKLGQRLRGDGFLVIGSHEQLPDGELAFPHINSTLPIYRKSVRA